MLTKKLNIYTFANEFKCNHNSLYNWSKKYEGFYELLQACYIVKITDMTKVELKALFELALQKEAVPVLKTEKEIADFEQEQIDIQKQRRENMIKAKELENIFMKKIDMAVDYIEYASVLASLNLDSKTLELYASLILSMRKGGVK